MRTRTVSIALGVAALLLTGCEPSGTGDAGKPSAEAEESAQSSEPGQLPRLVGKGLQSAQDTAQEAGFRNLASHDALGRSRAQAFDRNWKVCFQSPGPGEHPVDVEVDLAAVKLDEECPAKDNEPEQAASTMPDFTGKSVRAARQALAASTSVDVQDASGRERIVLLGSNWQICSHEPEAGAELTGQPVTLKAVKYGESCP